MLQRRDFLDGYFMTCVKKKKFHDLGLLWEVNARILMLKNRITVGISKLLK